MNVNFEYIINRSVKTIFDAIVDSKQMSNYFISNANSSLEEHKVIKWEFADIGSELEIFVKKIEENSLIQFEWNTTGKPTTVEINLESLDDNTTKIKITEGEWENNEEGSAKVMQQSIGWTDFFCGLKAYVLFNVNLRTGKNLNI